MKLNKKLFSKFVDLVDLYGEERPDKGFAGINLYNIIMHILKTNQISLTNFIGFAADSAANIMGSNNSLSSRLKNSIPGLIIFKCACHSLHLCSSNAAKKLQECARS